jgi:tetratricopeptide (TPR) repeat protein
MPNEISAIAAWKQIWQGSLQGTARNAALQGIRTILENVKQPDKLHDKTWQIFREFIEKPNDNQLLNLICHFEWNTEAPKASSLSLKLQERLIERQQATDDIQAEQQYQKLFVYLFKILCEPGIKKLTVKKLIEQLSDTLSESDHQLLKDVVNWVHALEEGMEALEQNVSQNNEEILLIKEKVLCLDRERSKPYDGQDVASRVKELLRDYTTKLFVGREDALSKLDKFLTQTDKKYLTITAPAGFGKTALLVNWIAMRQDKGYFIAYHFFQRDDITRSVSNAYRNLLRQLHDYYESSDKSLPTNEDELRDKLRYLLENYEVREDKPLVIVVDGLDEASPERSLSLFLPQPLPKGLYVIVSVRVNEVEKLDNLNLPTQVTQKLHLNPLLSPTIADWLRRTGNESLVSLAQDETFVKQVCDRTEGRPLFLKYLIDELVEVAQQGEESAIRKTLAATPKGFPDYIRQQYQALDRLEDWRSRRELRKIFYFLTIAKGELSSYDFVKLMGESPVGLPWQVSRWFKIRQIGNLRLFSFDHSTLAKQFAALPEINENTEESQEKLIEYCANWQKHQKSLYALRHYAEHLRDVERWEELYAIARDEDFASTQQQQLLDEPDLPLKTVQTALLGAAEEDKAERMAEFLLVHAHRLGQTNAQESPLDALRSGSLKRAWVLAEQFEIERCVLWYLLLAWELKDEGKLDDARETLEKLQQKDLLRFQINGDIRWQGDYAAYLLAYVFDINKDTSTVLVQQLLENDHRRLVCKTLSEHGDFDDALDTAQVISSELDRVSELERIGKGQAAKGQKDAARSTFGKALEIIHKAAPHILWVHEIVRIAEAQLEELEDLEAARNTLENAFEKAQNIFTIARKKGREIEDQEKRKDTLLEIARMEAKVNELINDTLKSTETNKNQRRTIKDNSNPRIKQNNSLAIAYAHAKVENFSVMLEIMEKIEGLVPIKALASIANALAEEGLTKTARTTFATALQIHQGSETAFLQALALSDVADVQVASKQKEAGTNTISIAHQIAQEINNPTKQVIALAGRAKVLANTGKRKEAKAIFDNLLEIAQNIKIQEERVKSFRFIAKTQISIKELTAAFRTAQKIEFTWIKAKVLGMTAKAEVEAGLEKESQATLCAAFGSAEVLFPHMEGLWVDVMCDKAMAQAVKHKEAALATFRELLEFAQKSGKQRDIDLSKIAAAQAQAGEISPALETTDEIEDELELVKALSWIALTQFQKGKKQELSKTLTAALQAKEKIEDKQKLMQALKTIAKIQAMAGKGEEAVRTTET